MASITEKTVFDLINSIEQFPVDFDKAWKWLEFSRKDNAKTSFLGCGFSINVDYCCLNTKESDNHAGLSAQQKAANARRDKIVLTLDCFKMWCMMADTAKGKKVRLYFLDCEKKLKEIQAAQVDAKVQQRLDGRLSLRDDARLTMCNEIKARLEEIGQYNTKKSGWVFALVHDGINLAITGETSQSMRERLSLFLGRKVSDDELIRDYFPTQVIWKYLAFCNAIANLVKFPPGANNDSLEKEIKVAILKATKVILRPDYIPTKINFEEDVYALASKVLKQLPS